MITLIIAAPLYRILLGKKVEDWYWNGFFYYFLIWKLSYIIFNFNMFLNTPLSVVYYNGGIKGHILALVTLSVYLLFIALKKYQSIYNDSAQIFLLFFICYEVVLSILEKYITATVVQFILLIGYLIVLYFLKKRQTIVSEQLFIIIVMLEFVIYSFFNTFLSLEVFTFTWIAMTMFIILKKNKEAKYE